MNAESDWAERSPQEALLRRVWVTRAARFNAYRRLSDRAWWVSRATSFLAAYLIIAAVTPFVGALGLDEASVEITSFAIVAFSIVLLVLSILEHTEKYTLEAFRLHECAIELNRLYAEAESAFLSEGESDIGDWKRYREEYYTILRGYEDVNHLPVDYDLVRYQRPSEFGVGVWKRVCGLVWTWIRTKFVYLAVIVCPPTLLATWLV